MADLPPARKIPFIWEIPALAGLDRIDPAVVPIQEDTGVILLLEEG